MKRSVRFHIELRVVRNRLKPESDVWQRETLSGAKSLADARVDLRQLRREGPMYFKRDDWRIVKITTTTEIVK